VVRTSIYKLTLAVFNGYKKDAQGNKIIGDSGYPEKETLYVNLTAFGKAAETLVNKKDNDLTKGALVMVEARYNGFSTFPKSDNSGVGVNVDFVIDSSADVIVSKSSTSRQGAQGQANSNHQPIYGQEGHQPGAIQINNNMVNKINRIMASKISRYMATKTNLLSITEVIQAINTEEPLPF
jgi:single-stranded DNA-binding protein